MKALPLRIVALLATASWSAHVLGQVPDTGKSAQANSDNGGGQIEEIVVTAQRRSEAAQKVPITLQSFSPASLDKLGVKSTEDLTTAVSGLIIQQAGARPAVFLRGVGNNSANTTPSVLTFVDGVYQPFGFLEDLGNVERIEVLKGPQGTLFGRNATGGVIQIITKQPSEVQGAQGEIGYGNYNTVEASGYATTGLAPGVAIDLAFRYHNQMDGFGTNVATGGDAYTSERATVRSRIRADLSDVTTLTLSGDYSEVHQTQGSVFAPAFGYGYLFVDGALRRFGSSYFPNKYDIDSGMSPIGTNTREWGGSATLETEFSGLKARSITSYRLGSEQAIIDSDGGPATALHALVNRPRKSFTQELQLLSGDDGAFQWVAGAFYYRGELDSSPFGFFGTTAQALFGLPPGGIITDNATDIDDSVAGYAQASYEFTSSTKVTLGARYTVESRTTQGTVSINGLSLPARAGKLSTDINVPTWRIALDQNITPGIMAYASVSRGFNSGFFNSASVGGFASEKANPRVAPEFLTAYEIGAKSDLLDRKLRVNTSAFYYDYRGLQQQVYQFGSTLTINAGSATIKGAELEIVARPVDSLTLSLSGTYLDSSYQSYPLAPNYVQQPNGSITAVGSLDAAGKTVINTPKVNYNLLVSHVLESDIGSFTTSANLSYRGRTFVDPQNRFQLPTRYVMDLTEKWTSSDDRYFISAFIKNLFDKQYDFAISVVSPVGLVGLHAPPRTYGMSAGFKF